MKKDHPILFSTPMVQAILEGRKTQTRRIIKRLALDWLQPDMFTPEFVAMPENNLCPYGNVGDVLWVRESWNASTNVRPEISEPFIYKADRSEIDGGAKWAAKWKPSIHMPKAACRLFLEITSVRVERLHDISEDDAKAEGVQFTDFGLNRFGQQLPGYHVLNATGPNQCLITARMAFYNLWERINGEASLAANPWVWVLEFKQIKRAA